MHAVFRHGVFRHRIVVWKLKNILPFYLMKSILSVHEFTRIALLALSTSYENIEQVLLCFSNWFKHIVESGWCIEPSAIASGSIHQPSSTICFHQLQKHTSIVQYTLVFRLPTHCYPNVSTLLINLGLVSISPWWDREISSVAGIRQYRRTRVQNIFYGIAPSNFQFIHSAANISNLKLLIVFWLEGEFY